MILFDNDIERAMFCGSIIISPFDRNRLGPNSYDLSLGERLLIYSDDVLDFKRKNDFIEVDIPQNGIVLKPGELYLGVTREIFGTTREHVPHITGRSSTARLGVSVHETAGFGDVGYVGHWTLEITVTKPVRVYPGTRIAQAYFVKGLTFPNNLYSGKYTDSFESNTPIPYRGWIEK